MDPMGQVFFGKHLRELASVAVKDLENISIFRVIENPWSGLARLILAIKPQRKRT